jgi:hypothetical protein
MRHVGSGALRVATIHNMIKKPGRVLPRPSAIFHAYALADTLWVARTLSHCTPVKRGKVLSNSSINEATQLGDSIYQVCTSTFQMLVHSDPTDVGLNRHRWGLPPCSSEFMIQASLNLPIQYSPLSPNCPTRSLIMPNRIIISLKPHRTSIDRNGPITSGF